jgi:hypothetical protein
VVVVEEEAEEEVVVVVVVVVFSIYRARGSIPCGMQSRRGIVGGASMRRAVDEMNI